jgi:hypothetical protein
VVVQGSHSLPLQTLTHVNAASLTAAQGSTAGVGTFAQLKLPHHTRQALGLLTQ